MYQRSGLGILLFFMTMLVHAASITWETYSEAVFQEAKSSHRQVLIYGYSPTCHFCARMNRKTFTDPVVIDRINKKYVATKLDTEANAPVADQYGMYVVPAVIILDNNANLVSAIYGYQNAADLMTKL